MKIQPTELSFKSYSWTVVAHHLANLRQVHDRASTTEVQCVIVQTLSLWLCMCRNTLCGTNPPPDQTRLVTGG